MGERSHLSEDDAGSRETASSGEVSDSDSDPGTRSGTPFVMSGTPGLAGTPFSRIEHDMMCNIPKRCGMQWAMQLMFDGIHLSANGFVIMPTWSFLAFAFVFVAFVSKIPWYTVKVFTTVPRSVCAYPYACVHVSVHCLALWCPVVSVLWMIFDPKHLDVDSQVISCWELIVTLLPIIRFALRLSCDLLETMIYIRTREWAHDVVKDILVEFSTPEETDWTEETDLRIFDLPKFWEKICSAEHAPAVVDISALSITRRLSSTPHVPTESALSDTEMFSTDDCATVTNLKRQSDQCFKRFTFALLMASFPGVWMSCRYDSYVLRGLVTHEETTTPVANDALYHFLLTLLVPFASFVASFVFHCEICSELESIHNNVRQVYIDQVRFLYCISTDRGREALIRIYDSSLDRAPLRRLRQMTDNTMDDILKIVVRIGDNTTINTLHIDRIRVADTLMSVSFHTIRIQMQHVLLIMASWIIVTSFSSVFSMYRYARVTTVSAYLVLIFFYLAFKFFAIVTDAVHINDVRLRATTATIENWRGIAQTKRREAILQRPARSPKTGESNDDGTDTAWPVLMDGFDQLSQIVKDRCPMKLCCLCIDRTTRSALLYILLSTAFTTIFGGCLRVLGSGIHGIFVSMVEFTKSETE